jgi:hypothetical protein
MKADIDMGKVQNKSVIGNIVNFGLTVYVGIGLAVSVAFTLHILGLGRTIIPGWVGYVCSPLIGVAFFVAVRKSDLRGVLLGALIFGYALLHLGFSDVVGMPEVSTENIHDLAHAAVELRELIASAFPIVACVIAISLPLIYPKRNE